MTPYPAPSRGQRNSIYLLQYATTLSPVKPLYQMNVRVLLAVLLATTLTAANAAQKPNIVYIMSDELTYFELSHMGNPHLKNHGTERR